MAKSQKKELAIIYWRDACIHGSDQKSTDDWRQTNGLISGIAAGIVVDETREYISIAMDWFPPDQRQIFTDAFRIVSSYPKSGISKIIRRKIG